MSYINIILLAYTGWYMKKRPELNVGIRVRLLIIKIKNEVYLVKNCDKARGFYLQSIISIMQ